MKALWATLTLETTITAGTLMMPLTEYGASLLTLKLGLTTVMFLPVLMLDVLRVLVWTIEEQQVEP